MFMLKNFLKNFSTLITIIPISLDMNLYGPFFMLNIGMKTFFVLSSLSSFFLYSFFLFGNKKCTDLEKIDKDFPYIFFS